MSDQPNQPSFNEVLKAEIGKVDARRIVNGRDKIRVGADGLPMADADVVGLALSGGGIRSAAFCLGALQALGDRNLLKNVDYLSTVSGGGYIGSALTAATSKTGSFPFGREQDGREAAGIQHIRDYSNYLFPSGLSSFVPNFVIYLRGLAANALLILPFLLLFAVVNIVTNRNADNLGRANLAGLKLHLLFQPPAFGITLYLLMVLALFISIWALQRSLTIERYPSEVGKGRFNPFLWGTVLLLLLAVLFAIMELQPWVLKGMFDSAKADAAKAAAAAANKPAPQAASSHLATVTDWLKLLGAILAPLATIIGLLSGPLAAATKRGTARPGWISFLSKGAATLAVYIAGLSIPFLLWLAHIYLSYWGICKASAGPCETYAPGWLNEVAKVVGGPGELWRLYVWVAGVTFVASWFLTPNANSLHRLYRDRLSKAFLFDPDPSQRTSAFSQAVSYARRRANRTGSAEQAINKKIKQDAPSVATAEQPAAENPKDKEKHDLAWLDDVKLGKIRCESTPYHLLGTALNIEGSKYANRRGRNADFFFFSPLFVGGEATGYASTADMEEKVGDLDLATAMAISGAAAAANMGVNTIKPLTMTLAILNVRVGYWLPNPRVVAGVSTRSKLRSFFDNFYFLWELLGLLKEDSDQVYLTDGGHLENLGVYELLRRRCRLIIAVDAEADPGMTFGSLMALQRMARIDLGIGIELPWAPIREAMRKADAALSACGGQLLPENAAKGPHCAIGVIKYPDGGDGILLYVKSSFTGDESDYIVDYKRRFEVFPQETTLDQLFSEEQFEVYRALGRHVMDGVLSGRDEIGVRVDDIRWRDKAKWAEKSTEPLITQAYEILCTAKNSDTAAAPLPRAASGGDTAQADAQVLPMPEDG